MKILGKQMQFPVLAGFLLTLPFIILDLINQREVNEDFPIPLFVTLWFLSVVFIALLMPIIHDLRAGENILAHPFSLTIRIIFMSLATWMWISIVIDQMPCFMGVPNCD